MGFFVMLKCMIFEMYVSFQRYEVGCLKGLLIFSLNFKISSCYFVIFSRYIMVLL